LTTVTPTGVSGRASILGTSVDDMLTLAPRITPNTVIGGMILIGSGFTLALVGVRRRLIQIFLSTSLTTGLSIALLIDYVMKPLVSDGPDH